MISTPFGPEFHGGSRLFLSHWIVISWRFVYIGYFFFVFVRSFSADLIDYEIPFMYLHVGVLCSHFSLGTRRVCLFRSLFIVWDCSTTIPLRDWFLSFIIKKFLSLVSLNCFSSFTKKFLVCL